MSKFFLLLILSVLTLAADAQDKIILLNGKEIPVKSAELTGSKIAYRKPGKDKLKKIASYRTFSINHADGTETIVYTKDPFDSLDFSVESMRMFIKGEQEADLYYHNNVNKVTAAAIGAGASALAIYGLIIPAFYSTMVGAYSPDMEKHKVSDPALRDNLAFREGYESKCRNKKISSSLLFGYGGFAIGIAAIAIFSQ